PEHQQRSLAKDRILSSDQLVIDRDPDIMLASWCGKAFKPERVHQRPGWAEIAALQESALHEIPGSIILQPGPAALLEGLPLIHSIFQTWIDANGGTQN
ncbi:MAG: cobalamin-binding protein, partial [Bacteroidota bacterium]